MALPVKLNIHQLYRWMFINLQHKYNVWGGCFF